MDSLPHPIAVPSKNQLGSYIQAPPRRFLGRHLRRHDKKSGNVAEKAGEKKANYEESSAEAPTISKIGNGDKAFDKPSVIGKAKMATKFGAEKEVGGNPHEFRRSQRKPKKIIAHKPSITKTAVVNRKRSVFKCSQCPITHLDRNLLLKHAADCHNRKVFECPNCQNLYTNFCNMMRHMKVSHPNNTSLLRKDTKCTKCDLEFPTSALLLQHKKDKHNLKLHKCDLCSNEFTNFSNMLRHRKSHGPVPEQREKLKTLLPRVYESVKKKEKQDVLLNDQFPVLIIENKTESTKNYAEAYLELLDKVNQKKAQEKQKFEKDASFFLHLNRYDPASI